MNYLRLLRLWLQVERRAHGLHRAQDAAERTHLSLALPSRSTTGACGTAALSWSSADPLAVHLSYLQGTVRQRRVIARDGLRSAVPCALQLGPALAAGATMVTLNPRGVRRFLRATDAVVPRRCEARLVAEAAAAFLHDVVLS
ncbi:MAG: SsgA family sporulation/cell division regulator [Actinomycetota bacterium]|nr:SsgA family sporulation/cell division regulator [Actinomycetota bacterium]